MSPDAYLLKERRVYPRISVKIPIVFRVLDDKAEIKSILDLRKKEKHGHTMDVSLGGLCVMSEQPVQTGNVLRLDISIPDTSKSLKAMAEVVWANDTGGGIRFLAMDEADIETLKSYLSKAATKR
jgi:c-di-GMP-binding flagellar brake protein YcgR